MLRIAIVWNVIIFSVVLTSSLATAGQFNAARNIGDAGPTWKDLPGTDGKTHSLAELDKKVVVVVFTCNSCPVATDYQDRIIALAKKYADRVAVVAINVNRTAEDGLEKMKQRAEEKQYPYPYLFDETQKIAKDYGAAFTPEFFVLGPDRKIVYMGGMDDNSNPAEVKANYLAPAVEAALAGTKPDVAEAAAIGCRIRFARERR
jgi:peroxiredoxin